MSSIKSWELGELYLLVSQLNPNFSVFQFPFPHPYSSQGEKGQRRMKELHNGYREALEISSKLWAGIGLVRGGAGTALVGDPYRCSENAGISRNRYRYLYLL